MTSSVPEGCNVVCEVPYEIGQASLKEPAKWTCA